MKIVSVSLFGWKDTEAHSSYFTKSAVRGDQMGGRELLQEHTGRTGTGIAPGLEAALHPIVPLLSLCALPPSLFPPSFLDLLLPICSVPS